MNSKATSSRLACEKLDPEMNFTHNYTGMSLESLPVECWRNIIERALWEQLDDIRARKDIITFAEKRDLINKTVGDLLTVSRQLSEQVFYSLLKNSTYFTLDDNSISDLNIAHWLAGDDISLQYYRHQKALERRAFMRKSSLGYMSPQDYEKLEFEALRSVRTKIILSSTSPTDISELTAYAITRSVRKLHSLENTKLMVLDDWEKSTPQQRKAFASYAAAAQTDALSTRYFRYNPDRSFSDVELRKGVLPNGMVWWNFYPKEESKEECEDAADLKVS